MNRFLKNFRFDASFFLSLGLAFSFIYAAIDSFVNPSNWVGFVPQFVSAILSKELFLILFSVVELILGLWLISGFRRFYAAVVSTVVLIALTIPNLALISVIFRDISLILMAIGLAVLEYRKNEN